VAEAAVVVVADTDAKVAMTSVTAATAAVTGLR
jgi:hypothetical protein